MSSKYEALQYRLDMLIETKKRMQFRHDDMKMSFIGLPSHLIPEHVQESFIELVDEMDRMDKEIATIRSQIGCRALKELLHDDGYALLIEHENADWINYTTQVKEIRADDARHGTYRLPKPVTYSAFDNPVSEMSPAMSKIEYDEYEMKKWQTSDGHRYYIGVNKEANTVLYAYVGRA